MIKVIVVEDEAIAARRLTKMLEAENLTVVQHLKSNKELSEYVRQYPEPQLFFMDIHLNDGIVFEFLQSTTLNAPIIFTTAYDEYAIKAFKQNSIDYLLKPIDKEELHLAIEKFRKLNIPAMDPAFLTHLFRNQQTTPIYRERIKIKIGDRIKSISIEDIRFLYSKDKLTFVRNIENRSYPIDYALDSIFQELNPKEFYKVNRSFVVSIKNIQEVISYSNSRLKIIMKDAAEYEIIVARDRVADFKNWLG